MLGYKLANKKCHRISISGCQELCWTIYIYYPWSSVFIMSLHGRLFSSSSHKKGNRCLEPNPSHRLWTPGLSSESLCLSLLGLRLSGLNNKNVLSHSFGGWKSQIKVWQDLFLVRTFFLACRWTSSHYVFTWQIGREEVMEGEREREGRVRNYDVIW